LPGPGSIDTHRSTRGEPSTRYPKWGWILGVATVSAMLAFGVASWRANAAPSPGGPPTVAAEPATVCNPNPGPEPVAGIDQDALTTTEPGRARALADNARLKTGTKDVTGVAGPGISVGRHRRHRPGPHGRAVLLRLPREPGSTSPHQVRRAAIVNPGPRSCCLPGRRAGGPHAGRLGRRRDLFDDDGRLDFGEE
jgi:hypothetical protein